MSSAMYNLPCCVSAVHTPGLRRSVRSEPSLAQEVLRVKTSNKRKKSVAWELGSVPKDPSSRVEEDSATTSRRVAFPPHHSTFYPRHDLHMHDTAEQSQ